MSLSIHTHTNSIQQALATKQFCGSSYIGRLLWAKGTYERGFVLPRKPRDSVNDHVIHYYYVQEALVNLHYML